MTKGSNNLMGTSFYVEAILKGEITDLKKQLDEISYLKKIGNTSVLKYEIVHLAGEYPNSTIEFSGKYINLEFFFSKQTPYQYKDNLLILISLIGFLNWSYDIKFGSIYRYIVEALGQNFENLIKEDDQKIHGLKERVKSLNESNCSLSNKIIILSDENRNFSKSLDLHRKFSHDILSKLKGRLGGLNESSNFTIPINIDVGLMKKVELEIGYNR
jgi:hypothetical protein